VAAQRSAHRKEVAPTVAGDDAVLEPALRRQGQARSTIGWRGGRHSIQSSHLDDATSVIYSAFLVEEDGTASSFRGLSEVIAAKGLFASLYTDPGSRYFLTSTTAERNRFPLSRNNASRGCGRAFSTATPHFRNLLNRRTVILYR